MFIFNTNALHVWVCGSSVWIRGVYHLPELEGCWIYWPSCLVKQHGWPEKYIILGDFMACLVFGFWFSCHKVVRTRKWGK